MEVLGLQGATPHRAASPGTLQPRDPGHSGLRGPEGAHPSLDTPSRYDPIRSDLKAPGLFPTPW